MSRLQQLEYLTDRHEPTVLWYLPVAEPGGAARHVLDVATTGIPGWRLTVLCPEGKVADQLRTNDVRTVTAEVSPQAGPVRALRHVRRIAAQIRPDVLHTHLAFADLIGIAAVAGLRSRLGSRIRTVPTEHGISGARGFYQSNQMSTRARAFAHRRRLRHVDEVIAVSRSTAFQIEEQWGRRSRITVIPNGVNAPTETVTVRPGLRVLSFARLAPEKRIDDLIRGFAELTAGHPEARLTIAGAGESEAELRRLVTVEDIANAVDFAGVIDPARALREHDVVAQLSVWENLSYTLLDALTHGLGIIATEVGGNVEILPPHCFVDPGDPAAVAAALNSQGLDIAARPQLAGRVSDVTTMCRSIARIYSLAMK